MRKSAEAVDGIVGRNTHDGHYECARYDYTDAPPLVGMPASNVVQGPTGIQLASDLDICPFVLPREDGAVEEINVVTGTAAFTEEAYILAASSLCQVCAEFYLSFSSKWLR